MPAFAAICPTCSMRTLDGVCPHCALSAALAGIAGPGEIAPSSPHGLEPPAGYDLVHELGSGATATVWLARERKLDRLVALKLIAATVDQRLTRRLVREGRAAARLRHPHIVTVHALGETAQHAFLAMDFLEGGDLRQKLAREPLAPRAAAGLVRKLAAALAHAHANGVLHRDIKPSNVLLDSSGEPHLADFGLAAPLEGGGDLTLPGQVAGTAAYLAPELLAGADHATPLSDLYGLGAVLYESLTGRAPFVGDSAAAIFAQLARNEPPAPRLLRPDLPRDLETIALKCLEKTPARRYVSAEALHDDLGRFLRGEPIAARPVSRPGRALRWCARNPLTATFAAAATLLLLCLALGGPLLALRLARANARVAREAAASKAVSDFLQKDLLAQAAPERQPDRDLKLRAVLDRAAQGIDGRFPGQPLVEADVRDTLATTYFSLGEYEAARRQWACVRELRQRELGPEDPKTLRAMAGLFDALRALGKYRDAEALAVNVIAAQRRILGPGHADTLASSNRLAALYRQQGKLGATEALYVNLLRTTRERLGAEHATTLSIANNLALVFQEQGKFPEAEALHRERLAIVRRQFGDAHPSTLTSWYNLALLCSEAGKVDEAHALCSQAVEGRARVLGPDHPDTLHAMRVLAWIKQDLGKFAEAERMNLHVIATQERKLGARHPDTLVTKHNLGRLYRDLGRLDEAEAIVAETLEARERALGAHNPFTLASKSLLAGIFRDTGRLADAKRLGTEAVADCERFLNPAHPFRIVASAEAGRILVACGDFAAAEPLLRFAFERWPKTPAKAWRAALVQSQLGQALLALERFEEAEPALLASCETLERDAALMPPAIRPELSAAKEQIARLYAEWKRPEKSVAAAAAK